MANEKDAELKDEEYAKELPPNFAVKVYTTGVEYDYETPWKAPKVGRWSGSGFVIEGNKIVTNAHVAAGAKHIEIRLANDADKSGLMCLF